MLTIDESIPQKSDAYRVAEDIFYSQFNDISFFVEDIEQENFYFITLRKLFPNLKLEKIFPLNGKDNVLAQSAKNLHDKTKVFIVDLDFDEILNKKHNNANLFYLQKYSIENYLIEENSIVDYIISERPKLRKHQINADFNIEESISNIGNALRDIIYLHIVVQSKCPTLKNISLNHERFFIFNSGNFNLRKDQLEIYINNIERELEEVDKRVRLASQLKKAMRLIKLDTHEDFLKYIPGKYLIRMLKQVIESSFSIASRNADSFCYRLSEKCEFNTLNHLKIEVEDFIK